MQPTCSRSCPVTLEQELEPGTLLELIFFCGSQTQVTSLKHRTQASQALPEISNRIEGHSVIGHTHSLSENRTRARPKSQICQRHRFGESLRKRLGALKLFTAGTGAKGLSLHVGTSPSTNAFLPLEQPLKAWSQKLTTQ